MGSDEQLQALELEVLDCFTGLGDEVLEVRRVVVKFQGGFIVPAFQYVEGARLRGVLMQFVVLAAGFLAAGRDQGAEFALEDGLLLGLGDQRRNRGKGLGYGVFLRGVRRWADNWLFLLKIKPAKRAVSFNNFLIIRKFTDAPIR